MDAPKQLVVERVEMLDLLPMSEVAVKMRELEQHHIDCVNWAELFPYCPQTSFSIAYSLKYIYVSFSVVGEDLRAVNVANLSPVAQDSCVEFFLQVPGFDEYWNFEFNCIGTVNASHRKTRPEAIRLTDEQIDLIKRESTCGIAPFEEKNGVHDWGLTIAIPFDLLGINSNNLPGYIMGNFYKCADATRHRHYVSWSPILADKPNFHLTQHFGKIELL